VHQGCNAAVIDVAGKDKRTFFPFIVRHPLT
jgi:hypothetical protein